MTFNNYLSGISLAMDDVIHKQTKRLRGERVEESTLTELIISTAIVALGTGLTYSWQAAIGFAVVMLAFIIVNEVQPRKKPKDRRREKTVDGEVVSSQTSNRKPDPSTPYG